MFLLFVEKEREREGESEDAILSKTSEVTQVKKSIGSGEGKTLEIV